MLRRHVRSRGLRLALTLCCLGLVGWGDAPSSPKAVVTLEIAGQDQELLSFNAKVVRWGEQAVWLSDAHEHKHRVRIQAWRPEDDASEAKVRLVYERDDQALIKRLELHAPLGVRKSVKSDDGHFTVGVKLSPAPPRKKIELPDGEDPLTGLP